jgi:hypothetical protein
VRIYQCFEGHSTTIFPTNISMYFLFLRSRGSSVSIMSDYGLDDRGSIPGRGKGYFSSSLCVQTGSGAHPASSTMGTGGPFLGGKARLGRDADHSPPSSAEVVNEYELYLLSPQAPPWRVEGLLYFTLLLISHQSVIYPSHLNFLLSSRGQLQLVFRLFQ